MSPISIYIISVIMFLPFVADVICMSWLDKMDSVEGSSDGYVKPWVDGSEVTIDLDKEPVKRSVKGTDGVDRVYMDLYTLDSKVMSCTGFLFSQVRKELEQLKGKSVSQATLRVKKVTGEKVSWVVVLVKYQ